jgi:hypothetical protein
MADDLNTASAVHAIDSVAESGAAATRGDLAAIDALLGIHI